MVPGIFPLIVWSTVLSMTILTVFHAFMRHLDRNYPLVENDPVGDQGSVLPYDPVCGSNMRDGGSVWVKEEGKIYGFCSKECRDSFRENREFFLFYRENSGARALR